MSRFTFELNYLTIQELSQYPVLRFLIIMHRKTCNSEVSEEITVYVHDIVLIPRRTALERHMTTLGLSTPCSYLDDEKTRLLWSHDIRELLQDKVILLSTDFTYLIYLHCLELFIIKRQSYLLNVE
ncbi:uncharacterized protein LOC105274692 isoform X2 [Ooceraea biroi]|uniref:uncharacterized protein LOC105274692 isoform X2 n=1 Tax=Ooceraea biroi TaxID=2015173 RepID=UPI0009716E54|nr:uncharacterized protein LOC105274692 isoform X2 [Ooceraea biroi]